MRLPRAAARRVTVLLLLTGVLSACGQSGFYDQAYERLLSYVPNSVRTGCERVEYTFFGLPGHPPKGELARSHCSQSPLRVIDFTLFETKEAMDRAYERTASLPPQDVLGEDCAQLSDAQSVWRGSLVAEQEYAVDGKPRGTVFCEVVFGPGGVVEITWTNEPTFVLGSAQACCLEGFDRVSDLNRFHKFYGWWQGLLGAERSPLD